MNTQFPSLVRELIVVDGSVFYLLVKYTLHCTVHPAIPRITQNPAPVRRVIIIVNIMSLRRSRPQVRTSSTKIFSAYSHEQQMTIVSRSILANLRWNVLERLTGSQMAAVLKEWLEMAPALPAWRDDVTRVKVPFHETRSFLAQLLAQFIFLPFSSTLERKREGEPCKNFS